MSSTTRLSLPLIAPGQAQKHVTLNEALSAIDALVHLAVIGLRPDPPTTPQDGDRFIVSNPATGTFSGHGNAIALREGGLWQFLLPRAGWTAFNGQTGTTMVFDGTGWNDLRTRSTDRLGINTGADQTNRLAVSSTAALFTHEGSNCQIKVNKASTASTGTLLFQSGWSGRAEIGLAGRDHLSFKVSVDGNNWKEPLCIDPASGYVGIGTGAPEGPFHILRGSVGPIIDRIDDAPGAPGMTQRKARGTPTAKAAVQGDDIVQAMYAQGYDGQTYVGCANLRWAVDGAVTAGSIPTRVEFYACGPQGLSERMRLTSGGLVGIGTVQPSTALHVAGPVRVGQYAKATMPNPAICGAGTIIHVTDDAGGAVLAFSDGAVWRRVTDRVQIA